MESGGIDQGGDGADGDGEELQERGQSITGQNKAGQQEVGPRSYEDESPGDAIMFMAKMMDEEGKHTGNDDGGDELAKSEEVERESWIGRRFPRGASSGRIGEGDGPHGEERKER